MGEPNRREFLQGAAILGLQAADTATTGPAVSVPIALLCDPSDPIAKAPAVRWALSRVERSLVARGASVARCSRLEETRVGARVIAACGPEADLSREVLRRARTAVPALSEALVLAQDRHQGRNILLASGADPRGLSYALLETADRVLYSDTLSAALDLKRPISERPANAVRSVARIFSSEIEDKPWFYDRSFWESYLSMLAEQRFNRFSLMFGMAYDFLHEVTDAYLHFAYPFLVSPPGHEVRVAGLPDGERERNLETLRFISDTAVARGLDFHLGLWTHGFDWSRNPGVNYTIQGLTPETNAAYCRDAIRTLLVDCPAISGVVFRIHGESGIPEPSYTFWKTVFEGVVQCGRRVEINLHTKGLDQTLLDGALATGLPISVGPKFWAEHQGLPYQQASIRALEMPPRDQPDRGFFAKSNGSRRFLRYGYGDLLTEGRKYGVVYRVWPGSQRLLLWGDPLFAAGYARAASFCGSQGMEWCEPLSFKGRKGSGLPGGRDGYAEGELKTRGHDFEKYLLTYRLLGRALYNPETPPETCRRPLRRELGPAADLAGAALAKASRILPLLTTAHLPSAANNGYWPEVYTNMPIVNGNRLQPYSDTPIPKRFGTVSSLDPALFCSIDEHAAMLLNGSLDGRYGPIEVAGWLENLADGAARDLSAAKRRTDGAGSVAFRRLALDVTIQSGLGRFFAEKVRAGTLYAIYRSTGNKESLQQAIQAYHRARHSWAGLAAAAQTAYRPDITFGRVALLRGSWMDRLPAIDEDIADMEREAARPTAVPRSSFTPEQIRRAAQSGSGGLARRPLAAKHRPPTNFHRGEPLALQVQQDAPGSGLPDRWQLYCRPVNQSETYRKVEMERQGDALRGIIPASVTDTPFPVQYYFTVHRAPDQAWLFPGLPSDLCGQPYYVVRQASQ